MKWRADVTLALSVLLYAVTWQFDLYLSAYPNGFWAFNPFAWQLLFVFGAWCALSGARRMSRILSSPVTMWIAFAYLAFAFFVTMTWHFPQLGFLMPPVGLNLLISSYRFGKPMTEVARASFPMVLVLLAGVMLITYVPPLTTWLPHLFIR